jgi:hypothetical protein
MNGNNTAAASSQRKVEMVSGGTCPAIARPIR